MTWTRTFGKCPRRHFQNNFWTRIGTRNLKKSCKTPLKDIMADAHNRLQPNLLKIIMEPFWTMLRKIWHSQNSSNTKVFPSLSRNKDFLSLILIRFKLGAGGLRRNTVVSLRVLNCTVGIGAWLKTTLVQDPAPRSAATPRNISFALKSREKTYN